MKFSRADVLSALAQVIAKVPEIASSMPEIEAPPQDGVVTIEFGDEGELELVVHERGVHTVLYSTRHLDDLVHQASLRAVSGYAWDWEWKNRERFPEYQDDTRVTCIAKQIEIIRRIDPQWVSEFRESIPETYSGVSVARVEAHPVLSS
jgi:hypothetical protein